MKLKMKVKTKAKVKEVNLFNGLDISSPELFKKEN